MLDLITRLAKFSNQAFEGLIHAPIAITEFVLIVVGSLIWGAMVGMLALIIPTRHSRNQMRMSNTGVLPPE